VLDALHPVVNEEDLPAAVQLAKDRFAQHVVGAFDDVRLDRLAILGRRLDHADIAHAGQRHMQRARDRRRGHREDMHLGAHLLHALLVLHAEAVALRRSPGGRDRGKRTSF
jgi:hypothetical protein